MSLAPESRYAILDNPLKFADIRTHETWLGTRVPIDLPPAEDDHFLRPRPGERPDQLAARVPGWQLAFGDAAAGLWWVIADLEDNGIGNPFTDFAPDRILRCPSAARVVDLLST